MEKEIYNLIKKIMYEQYIKNLYDEKADIFEYPIKFEKITFDVLDIFNNLYFNKYLACLIDNAAVYAIKYNDINYINLFKRKNINKLINNDRIIRAMITQRAFYNINSKIKNKQNIDNEIKNSNKELYNKISRIYNIEVITKKLRKIILDFLKNYDNSEYEIILDLLLTSNKLDDKLILYDSFLNDKNLIKYKNLLFRIILSDNYLYLKSTDKDITIEYFQEFDDDNEMVEYLDKKILDILENNYLSELEDDEIRLNLYSNFIVYNILLSEQKQDYENIKEDKNAIKTLKKLNPIYFLDF